MELTIENILLIGSLLLFISIVAGKTSFKFGIPTLIFFLGVGMLAGSEGFGGIAFDDPKIAQFIGVVSLNVILFSGGLFTDWKSVKPIYKQGIVLSTFGVLMTAVFLGLFVFWITDFTIYESLLLGSIVSSTDAAAVFSILRSRNIALKHNLRPTLEFESGSNDPMAYVLTIIFLTLVVTPSENPVKMIPVFFQQMILGGLAGFGFGLISRYIINHLRLDFEGLYPIMMIALMFITFSTTDYFGGNGFLAIYICGIYLGNSEILHKGTILKMFDGLAWLMQIVLFLTLGLLAFPSRIVPIIGTGLLISAFLILVARPVAVLLSLIPFKMQFRRRVYISWVGLRGAVPIVFATYPLLAGIEKAEMIFTIVFFISLSSVLLQGTTISILAKWLGLALPEKEKKITEHDDLLFQTPKKHVMTLYLPNMEVEAEKRIVDYGLPESLIIVMIEREGQFLRPHGSTVLKGGDKLTILSDQLEDFNRFKSQVTGSV